MEQGSNTLIATLVADLEPVRPLGFAEGLAWALGAAGVTLAAVVGLFGLRPQLAAGVIEPLHLIACGLFLGLAVAASVAVVGMSRPQIGNDHEGWRWAAGMAGLLPLAGVVVAISRGRDVLAPESLRHGAECFAIAGLASLLVFALLVGWLRRGAPTAPDRAGMLAGVAAGSFGILAFSLHCPIDDIVHVGIWHSAVVLAVGAAGRLAVPRLIRW